MNKNYKKKYIYIALFLEVAQSAEVIQSFRIWREYEENVEEIFPQYYVSLTT